MGWTSRTLGFGSMILIALLCSACGRQTGVSFPDPERFADAKAGELVRQAGKLNIGDRSYDTEACMLTVPESRKAENRGLMMRLTHR